MKNNILYSSILIALYSCSVNASVMTNSGVEQSSIVVSSNDTNTATNPMNINGANTIAIGNGVHIDIDQNTDARGASDGSIAIGSNAKTKYEGTTAIGKFSIANGWRATAIGADAKATDESATAMGNASVSSGWGSTAYGTASHALEGGSTAIGNWAQSTAAYGTALGTSANAKGVYSTALGTLSKAHGYGAISIGMQSAETAGARQNGAISIGWNAESWGKDSSAVGANSKANGNYSSATGTNSIASGQGSIALGANSKANADSSLALGESSVASAKNGVTIGHNSQVSADSGIAIGAESVADRDALDDTMLGAVSVGGNGKTRQIINVAAGTQDTDAVNVAQLTDLQSVMESADDALSQRITDNKTQIDNNKKNISENSNAIKNNNQRFDHLESKVVSNEHYIRNVEKKMHRGLASQAALNGLFQPYGVGKFNFTAAVGGYNSETAIAVGSGYRVNEGVAVKAGIATNTGNFEGVTYNAGVNFEW